MKTTAIYDKHFKYFGIRPKTATLYGCHRSDIVAVEVTKADDQTEREQPKDVADYHAFLNYETGDFEFIYPSLVQTQICSPDFFKSDIAQGRGEICRVDVVAVGKF